MPPCARKHALMAFALMAAVPWPISALANDKAMVMAAIRADRWQDAAQAAQADPDPVAAKLVTFYRLLAPGAASLTEITAFQAANPDWPHAALLQRRRDEALAAEPDDATVLHACDARFPTMAAAQTRCAAAFTKAGRMDDAAAALRRAWRDLPSNAPAEAAFLHAHHAALRGQDMRARFIQLAGTDPDGAVRQIPRLDTASRALAQTWLAFRRDAPDAARLRAQLPSADANAPLILLEQARSLRRGEDWDAVRRLWLGPSACATVPEPTPPVCAQIDRNRTEDSLGAAEAALPPDRRTPFWRERNRVARQWLQMGRTADAYALAAAHQQVQGEPMAEAAFLAGWIALRGLHRPDLALPHFQQLAALSDSVITQGRAHDWLARTAAALGNAAVAHQEYERAAGFPTTYYGQLASLSLHETPETLDARILAARAPDPPAARALAFIGSDLVRAAIHLVAWGEPRRARAFLLQLEEQIPDAAGKALVARLAMGFDRPDQAVAVARLAGAQGVALVASGWPAPFDSPAAPAADTLSDLPWGPDPALSLSIARQESNFDREAASPVGARGMMQLMPATAQAVARQINVPYEPTALSTDARLNVRLGSAYLHMLLDRFGGTLPFAIAAYNAGPRRVGEWRAMAEPVARPRQTNDNEPDMVDWIESIPFDETRNYVQRVIENTVIYHALRRAAAPHPLAAWEP